MNFFKRRLYIVLYAFALGGALLYYFTLMGYDVFGRSATALYFVNLSSIILTMTGCYVVVHLDKFPSARRRLTHDDPEVVARARHYFPAIRILIFAFLLHYNVILYALAVYAQAPKYGVLISLIVGVLAWPSRSATNNPSQS